jgi:hypothetical protein
MKTTITVQSIHNGAKMKLTFQDEQSKLIWIERNAHITMCLKIYSLNVKSMNKQFEEERAANEKFKPIARKYETGKIGYYESLQQAYNLDRESPSVTGTVEEIKWQLCPKCNGTGQIMNPYMGTTSLLTIPCDVCNGAKILATPSSQSTTIERLTKALGYAQNKIYILEHTKNGVADHIRVDLMKLRDCVHEALNSIKK